jgi:hypothetical protein
VENMATFQCVPLCCIYLLSKLRWLYPGLQQPVAGHSRNELLIEH